MFSSAAVRSLMRCECIQTPIRSGTLVASVVIHAHMYVHVFGKSAAGGESLAAFVALSWPYILMSHHVRLEFIAHLEHLIAHWTHFDFSRTRPHVLRIICRDIRVIIAIEFALQQSLCVDECVLVEGILVGIGGAACTTHHQFCVHWNIVTERMDVQLFGQCVVKSQRTFGTFDGIRVVTLHAMELKMLRTTEFGIAIYAFVNVDGVGVLFDVSLALL